MLPKYKIPDEYRDPLTAARRLRRFALVASKDTLFRTTFNPTILEALDCLLAETKWLDEEASQ